LSAAEYFLFFWILLCMCLFGNIYIWFLLLYKKQKSLDIWEDSKKLFYLSRISKFPLEFLLHRKYLVGFDYLIVKVVRGLLEAIENPVSLLFLALIVF
jgi:hypothetical protein